MINIVTQRFIQCFRKLKEEGSIRSARQFAMSLDCLPQNFSEVLKERRDVTIELTRRAIDLYHFNARYLFSGDLPLFTSEVDGAGLKVLTIVTDDNNNERIVHVPIPAQAGYAGQMMEPSLMTELPNFSLPGYDHGTHRSFDVSGDSMDPTLQDADKVICSFVEPSLWNTNIKNNCVYVVVTLGDVLVKRVSVNSEGPTMIQLISDNSFFEPYFIELNQIRELWMVKSVLRNFKHSLVPSSRNELMDLKKTVSRQSHLISSFQSSLEKAIK